MDDGRERVEEGEVALAGRIQDRLAERRRGKRSGGDNREAVGRIRQAGHFGAAQLDGGLVLDCLLHRIGEARAVYRQRLTGRHLVAVGRGHDERVRAPQLLVQEAHSVALGIVGAERVGADQLREPVRDVGFGGAHRPHLPELDRHAAPRDLPRRLAAGEAAADDPDSLFHPSVPRARVRPQATLRRVWRLRRCAGWAGAGPSARRRNWPV